MLAFVRFTLLMGLIRLRCREIWCTALNLLPHGPNAIPALDPLARRIVILLARHVFVHGEHARQVLVQRFPSAAPKAVCIPHGHWIDFYPRMASGAQARQKLQLHADAFVFLQFGQCKPYKNLEGVVQATRSLSDERIVLWIAGHFSDAASSRSASSPPAIHGSASRTASCPTRRWLTACWPATRCACRTGRC